MSGSELKVYERSHHLLSGLISMILSLSIRSTRACACIPLFSESSDDPNREAGLASVTKPSHVDADGLSARSYHHYASLSSKQRYICHRTPPPFHFLAISQC